MKEVAIDMQSLEEAISAAEAEGRRQENLAQIRLRDHERAEMFRRVKVSEMEGVLKDFFHGAEGDKLRQALSRIGASELQLLPGCPVSIIRLKGEDEWEFVRVWVSGNYYRTRTETVFSPEGFASLLIHNANADPFCILMNLKHAIEVAWDDTFHRWRYRHDLGYRARVEAEQREATKAANRKITIVALTILAAIAALTLYLVS